MATYYKLIQRKNLSKGAQPDDKLWYAQAKSAGTSGLDRLCDLISDRSTVSSADVKAVLDSLVNVMKREMTEGKIVELTGFGNFRITFGSSGVETEKDFHANNIRKPKFTFTPGSALRDVAKTLKYEKFKVEVKVETEECARPHAG